MEFKEIFKSISSFTSQLNPRSKKYIKLGLAFVVVFSIIAVIFQYNFYLFNIKNSSSFHIYTQRADEENKSVLSLFGLYIIPKSADVVVVKSDPINLSYMETRLPNPKTFLPNIVHKEVYLKAQYDVASDGPSSGCAFGKYPKTHTYNCSDPENITRLNTDFPDYNPVSQVLPPTVAASSTRPPSTDQETYDQLFSFVNYKDGLLGLVATYHADSDEAHAVNMIFYNGSEEFKYPLNIKWTDDDLQWLNLAAATDGSDALIISNQRTGDIYIYESVDSKPVHKSIKIPSPGNALLCSLNSKRGVCYAGVIRGYTSNDGSEEQAFKDSKDGVLEIFELNGRTVNSSILRKNDAFEKLCVDSSNQIYTLSGSSLSVISVNDKTASSRLLDSGVNTFACGSKAFYIANNSIYMVNADAGVNELIYGNSNILLHSVEAVGETIHVSGEFSKNPGSAIQQFTLSERGPSNHDYRTIDVVEKAFESTNTSFEVFFSTNSIIYFLPVDSSGLKESISSATPKGVRFTSQFESFDDVAPPTQNTISD